jgi:hypothetical protein
MIQIILFALFNVAIDAFEPSIGRRFQYHDGMIVACNVEAVCTRRMLAFQPFGIPLLQMQLYTTFVGNDYGDEDIIPPKQPSNSNKGVDDNINVYEDDDDDEDFLTIPTKIPTQTAPLWELGNNFDHFINQCTIQSFLFLLKTCHDAQTVLWIENFTQPAIDPIRNTFAATTGHTGTHTTSNSKLLNYHGLATMNTTVYPSWDTYFYQLLQQPLELYIVESFQSYVPTYEMEINPSSLCTRLMSVREQIAREFVHDLSVLSTMNGQQLLMNDVNDNTTTELSSLLQQQQQSSSLSVNNQNANGPSRFILAKDECLFLDSWDANDGDFIMPSPLRKGNFDLLVLLTTQESIHRILNDNSNTEQDHLPVTISKCDQQFLSNFYLNRLVSHFTGRQPYGRANQFLQELLSQQEIIGSNDDDDSIESCATQQRIVEKILSTRQHVAREWSHHARTVPDLHLDIKRKQFDALMKSYDTPISTFDSNNELQ